MGKDEKGKCGRDNLLVEAARMEWMGRGMWWAGWNGGGVRGGGGGAVG